MDESASLDEMHIITEKIILSNLKDFLLSFIFKHSRFALYCWIDATELEQAVRVKHSERLAARRAKWAQKCARKSIEQRLGAMPVNSKYKLEVCSQLFTWGYLRIECAGWTILALHNISRLNETKYICSLGEHFDWWFLQTFYFKQPQQQNVSAFLLGTSSRTGQILYPL